MSNPQVKQRVSEFYDRVGWQVEADGFYQNARYEDLRPVSAEYIHKCHLRVNRHLASEGRYLLDAGSGPVQYPEYQTYSQGYQRRVCADISHVALKEARKRLGDHGLYVVADVAHLPFADGAFDGIVSLHTLHHLPLEDQPQAYREFHRLLADGKTAVVVNGWTESPMMRRWQRWVVLMERLGALFKPKAKNEKKTEAVKSSPAAAEKGTYIQKLTPDWLASQLQGSIRYDIRVWRSVSVRWLRAIIHRSLLGKLWLKLLFALEERSPQWYGENGQYPMIILYKDQPVADSHLKGE